MPKLAKELTVAAVARLRDPGRYAVGGVQGLHLRVTDFGTRLWVLRLVAGGKRLDIGLGNFEDVTLSQARDAARDKRKAARLGTDVRPARAPINDVNSGSPHLFSDVATELIASKSSAWKNSKHAAQWTSTLATYAYPVMGSVDVRDIALAHVLQVIQPIWIDKTETATRVRGRIEAVLDYATARQWRQGDNPARWKGLLDKLLPAPQKVRKTRHHKAMPIQDTPIFFSGLLANTHGTAALVLRLLILTATRSGEVRGARWDEFNLDERVWTIPAERMKAGVEHRVPLSRQALQLLSTVPRFGQDDHGLLFPSSRGSGAISDMSMTQLMRRRGLDCVPHGFRSTFRDWAGDYTQYPRDLVEVALAHTVGNKVEAAYRRKDALERRRPLMQDWADYVSHPLHAASAANRTRAKPPHAAPA
ncbi:MAG: tyrosine-type recombinase/integrase [Burkholderiaceae bacterium]|jgi:integrase|nr:tyrosine-type recombinase/integrase [Burkholderiaceae bacterium]